MTEDKLAGIADVEQHAWEMDDVEEGHFDGGGAGLADFDDQEVDQVTVAVCCSVLQCVAVCCSVLHCVVVRCSVLGRSVKWIKNKYQRWPSTHDIRA